jgi:HTH-type transcriptional regulator/antitoxin HigA
MITTEREYRITKARIANPEQAIARERARTDLTPIMRQMYVDALTSNLEEMAAEVRAYEDLKAGRVQIRSGSLADLPTVLIQARVARGWTQKQLADLLSVTEQTIQRYEATDYQGVALARLARIAEMLSVKVVGTYATATPQPA